MAIQIELSEGKIKDNRYIGHLVIAYHNHEFIIKLPKGKRVKVDTVIQALPQTHGKILVPFKKCYEEKEVLHVDDYMPKRGKFRLVGKSTPSRHISWWKDLWCCFILK